MNKRLIKIELTSSTRTKFATVTNWEDANIATKSIFKRGYWSDVYYTLYFKHEPIISGSIDLEPHSFHAPHCNTIITTHLHKFWTNISNADSLRYPFIKESDKAIYKRLLSFLPTAP